MYKKFTTICALLSMLLFSFVTRAQDGWPKTLKNNDGSTIKLYQFQPESYNNNLLKASAALSILKEGTNDPVFGVAWLQAVTATRGANVEVVSLQINSIKLPGDFTEEQLDQIQEQIENNAQALEINFPLADLQSSLELNNQQQKLAQQINNKPPKVIYSTSPSILVLIDGEPRTQHNKELGVDAVINTPFTLLKNSDGKFYLHGGKHWYMAPKATGPYSLTTSVPQKMQQVAELAAKNNTANEAAEKDENTIYKIIVSTEAAELIQSVGEAKFAPVENSNLLYVSNTGDDIFMDVSSQNYYVLISGRWFRSKTLTGNWEYTAADQLPDEFAKIPEGSPKDRVLASIAGTDAANDALEEAAVPQTAKVDRNSAQADVVYDGDPRFEEIEGTDLGYAVNTSASVIRWKGRYYSVDNGVWFEAPRANGPWVVSVSRPYAVALIPPRYPVYHMKYVYIYDVTPEYVYMGYTPGYLNTYIYGPTVVYGTGYYYRPWFGAHYYPRPYTWGFNVRYNPWIGWGVGYQYSSGWFNINIGVGRPWGYWSGGWWGPRLYRPAYCWSPVRYHGGYYGRNRVYYNNARNYNIVNRNYSPNIYRNRSGVMTRDYNRVTVNNRYNRAANGTPRYNNRNAYNNRNNVGSRPAGNDRPVRSYNPNNRTDPYNRNNRVIDESNDRTTPRRVTPENRNGSRNNRYNNTNRDPYNNRNANPTPGTTRPNSVSPENQTTMPGRITRPERGERLHNQPADRERITPAPNRNTPEQRPAEARPQRQPQTNPQREAARPQREAVRPQPQARPQREAARPQPQRQVQPRERQVQRRESAPARQREVRQGAGGERPQRGSQGGRPDRNN